MVAERRTDGTCFFSVQNEAHILVNMGGDGGLEFAGGLRRSFGNLVPDFVGLGTPGSPASSMTMGMKLMPAAWQSSSVLLWCLL